MATQCQHRRRLGYFAGSSAGNDRLCTCGGVLGTNADNESINGVPRLSLPVLPGVGVSGGPGSDLAPSVPGGQAVGVYISEGSYRGMFHVKRGVDAWPRDATLLELNVEEIRL
ncbi:hypothetical protein StoSoilB22_42020 [Arthrobacter sp. StoSoilB22]|nr:hypothetical protein StoSoilB22_42020 [Arthrobacter sp. StoSoilB22]